jgi:hypothetical protein
MHERNMSSREGKIIPTSIQAQGNMLELKGKFLCLNCNKTGKITGASCVWVCGSTQKKKKLKDGKIMPFSII